VERNRDDEVERLGIPISAESFSQFLSEEESKVALLFVFPSMDRFPERPFIIPHGPCHCKIFSPGQTSTAGMVLYLPGEKRDSAEGAQRRLNPPDLRETIRADPFLAFF
jgi:hypothetical protein